MALELKVISTGSRGNCYLLSVVGGSEALILDCGVKMKQLYRSMNPNVRYVGCLVTHEHNDHALAVNGLLAIGIKVYASQGTVGAIKNGDVINPAKPTVVKSGVAFKVGDFTVMPFDVEHDVSEPLGFLIRYDPTGETVVYATDTRTIRQKLPNVNYWIVECNYIDALLYRYEEQTSVSRKFVDRLKKSHMSLEELLHIFSYNDISKVEQIVLVHLSWERSDERIMVDAIQKITSKPTIAADDGMKILLNSAPF